MPIMSLITTSPTILSELDSDEEAAIGVIGAQYITLIRTFHIYHTRRDGIRNLVLIHGSSVHIGKAINNLVTKFQPHAAQVQAAIGPRLLLLPPLRVSQLLSKGLWTPGYL